MNYIFKIAVFSFLLSTLTACDFGLSDVELVKKAEEYLANGDQQSALIELKNAVKANTGNARARYLLGKTYYETYQFGEAAKELSKAKSLKVDNNLVLPLLAQAMVKSNTLSEVHFLPTAGLDRNNIATVLAAQAEASLLKNELKKAKVLIDDALLADSSSSYALLVKAKLHMTHGNSNQATIALQKSLEKDPNNFDAKQLSIDIAMQERAFDKAESLLNAMATLQPNSFLTRLKRAQTLVMLARYNDAAADLDFVLNASPKNSLANFLRGISYLKTAKPDLAQTALELTINSGGVQYPGASYGLGLIHYQKGNLSQAKAYTKQFIKSAPKVMSGLKLLALINMKQGDFSKAESLARNVIDTYPDDTDAQNILASALIQQSKNSEGVEILSRLAKSSPDSATSRLKLGIGLMSSGDTKQAQQELEVAFSMNPELPQTNISLVLSYIKQKDYDKALSAAKKYVGANPKSVGPKNLLATVHIAKGDIQKAKEIYSSVLTQEPGNKTANEKLAQIAIQNKNFNAARSRFNNILEHDNNHLQSLINLAALDALEKNTDGFITHLNQAIDAHPNALQPKLVLSRFYLATNQPEKALLSINKNETPDTNNPRRLMVIAMAHLQQNKFEDTIAVTSRILKKSPDMAQALLLRAKAFHASNKIDAAKIDLNSILKANPSALKAHFELANIALQTKNTSAFSKHLINLKKLAPEHPLVLGLRATSERLANNPKKVLSILETLQAKYPSSLHVNKLAFQQFQMGKATEGKSTLNKWLEKHPKDSSVLLNLANYELSQQQTNNAINTYKKVLNIQNNNVLALNNLAWLYKDSKPKKALELSQKALSIAPNAASVNDTLATVYLSNNQPEEAEKAIRKALKPDQNNPSILFHHAQILIALDKIEQATAILEKLALLPTAFAEQAEVKQLLTTLK